MSRAESSTPVPLGSASRRHPYRASRFPERGLPGLQALIAVSKYQDALALYRQEQVTLFDYDPTRNQTVPRQLLEGFAGYQQTVGYSG